MAGSYANVGRFGSVIQKLDAVSRLLPLLLKQLWAHIEEAGNLTCDRELASDRGEHNEPNHESSHDEFEAKYKPQSVFNHFIGLNSRIHEFAL